MVRSTSTASTASVADDRDRPGPEVEVQSRCAAPPAVAGGPLLEHGDVAGGDLVAPDDGPARLVQLQIGRDRS